MKKERLIILGSGPAGLTAALYAARADLEPLVLEGGEPGGQLMTTTDVENFPGFPDGIMGPQLIQNMKQQAERFGTRYGKKRITKVDFSDEKNLKLWAGDEELQAQSLIIATGARARWLPFDNGEKKKEMEKKYWGKGYTACATCDGAFYRDKIVGVVGGGDSACEEATFLTKFAKKVYLIHRRDELRASKPMQQRVFENEKIEVLWNKNVTDLKGEKKLEAVELTDSESKKTSELKLDGLFAAIGHIPNTDFLEGHLEMEDNKYLKVKNSTRTKVPSVFVAGDVADWRYRQAITAAGWGCMAALDAEHYLAEQE
ncbi:thioredoxin-disulfide reductase [Candidatus Gracilibacteria bacterium]|nr:thioredoxin-disulfide reductase [Candidatus Gracilibacteria bacterium]MCF7818998.1 thioredoxin-disulfide reductase [Candidatus Gracilibacteria bacterium]